MDKDISQLQQEQVKKLSELGEKLRHLREAQGLTLGQVAAITLIQSRLLSAIETGNIHQLPEPVYIRGFIKHYADALGLDGNEFSLAFPTELDLRIPKSSWKDLPAAQLRPVHLYVAYILLVMVAIKGLSYLMNQSAAWVNAGISGLPAEIQMPQTNSPESQPDLVMPSPASPKVEPVVPSKPVRIDVTVTDPSWIKIVADGKTQFQGLLPEGTKKTWTADTQLRIRAGNAGGVLVAYNKSQPQPLGNPGAVEERVYSVAQQAASLPGADPSLIAR